ncbi:hypothetical protein M5689_008582 [Euphorbia peplus]|nr:hypothetical protein M5689_008582 [Euphorbia peplus]
MSRTEKYCSPAYFLSGNPCLDFFFHIVPDAPLEAVHKRLQEAWNHDSLTSLKLMCNLRSVLGAGKSDKEGILCGRDLAP